MGFMEGTDNTCCRISSVDTNNNHQVEAYYVSIVCANDLGSVLLV